MAWAVLTACLCSGCYSTPPLNPPLPRELARVSLPDYVIEPPDVLLIDAIRLVPLPPYKIEPLDVLAINVTDTLPDQPISGIYGVDPEGTVNLGFTYGIVPVVGKTLDEIRVAIEKFLAKRLKAGFQVTVALAQFRGMQQIRGEHLVRLDGKVVLGSYGTVPVDGLTIEEARGAIQLRLMQFLQNPQISLDVSGYNSKVYYLITDGAGSGEQVYRIPITGNETVLDGLSQINGLPPVASKKLIWIARPNPSDPACSQVLPVDWIAITQRGCTETNYQILPGDRVYVSAQRLLIFDNSLAKIVAPIERLLGGVLLGNVTVRSFRSSGASSGTGGLGGF
jgi:polysaccharide export outer membrane protein